VVLNRQRLYDRIADNKNNPSLGEYNEHQLRDCQAKPVSTKKRV
jgi:hypothetical protein